MEGFREVTQEGHAIRAGRRGLGATEAKNSAKKPANAGSVDRDDDAARQGQAGDDPVAHVLELLLGGLAGLGR